MLTRSYWIALLGLLAACEDAVVPVPEVAAQTQPVVVGGNPVEVCQFPSTVAVGGCTGTLIHPRVVTTAAHCLNGTSASIRFGGSRNAPGSFTLMGRCQSGSRGASSTNRDWGYCVIPEDDRVKQLPITPPLVGCEAERFLKAGATGWIVGYGTTGPEGRGGGVKRAVEVKVNRVGNGTVDVGDRNVGACHGDSGGPIYMQIGDGTNDWGLRVFGSTSGPGAPRCDCTCSTLYVDIAMHVEAIEANENIDVTPCTDAEGNWDPGPDCTALQTAPMTGSGSFPACTVPRTTGPITSCGANTAPVAGSGGAAAAAGSGGAAVAAGSGGNAGRAGGGSGASAGATAGVGAPGVGAAGGGGSATAGTPAAGSSGRASDAFAGSPAVAAGVGASGAGPVGTSGALGVSTAGNAGLPAPEAGGFAIPTRSKESGCSLVVGPQPGRASTALLLAAGCLVLAARARRRRR